MPNQMHMARNYHHECSPNPVTGRYVTFQNPTTTTASHLTEIIIDNRKAIVPGSLMESELAMEF